MILTAAMEPARTREVSRMLALGVTLDRHGREGEPLRVPFSVLTGQVFVTGGTGEVTQAVTGLLGQLSAAGIPWLRVGRLPARTPDPSAVTVVDLTDPGGIPLTIDPFLPEPGYPEIAHADALSVVLEAAFGPPGPYRDVLSVGLRGLYAARVPHEPAPATSQIQRAVLAAARELGYGEAAETTLRGFAGARLGGLRGPATGMLLGGGHPADTAELVRRDVDLVTGDLGDPEGRALLAGTVALRIAEHASRFPRAAAGLPRHVLVLEEAGLLLRGSHAARQVARMLSAAGAHSTGIVITEHVPVPVAPWLADGVALTMAHEPGMALAAGPALRGPVTLRVPPPAASQASGSWPSVAGLIDRRMVGCAWSCRGGQPCTRDEIAAGAALAEAPGQEAAWLRLWAKVLLLAFLTGRPLPALPPPLRAAAGACRSRIMECALGTIAERAVAERAAAIRGCFPATSLIRALTGVGADMLAGRSVPGTAGHAWVIPQLRWAHEATRVGWARVPAPPGAPLRGTVCPRDLAPPLDFAIAGLPDWTGILAQDRLRALLRHPLSLEAAPNRGIAAAALFGERGHEAFAADLAADLAVVCPAPASSGTTRANSSPWSGLLADSLVDSLAEVAKLMDHDGDWLVTVMWWASNR